MTEQATIGPAQFNDPVATKCEWERAGTTESNNWKHKLVRPRPDRIELRGTWEVKLTALVLVLAGVGFALGLALQLASEGKLGLAELLFIIGFGVVFAFMGVRLWFFGVKLRVFDKSANAFWKKSKHHINSSGRRPLDFTPLAEIHAIQILREEYSSSSGRPTADHELNLYSKTEAGFT